MPIQETFRLANNKITTNAEEYAKAWTDLGNAVLAFFPGYVLSAIDPMLRFELHETSSRDNTYRTVDHFDLSPTAANCLLSKTAPPRVLREDF